MIDTDFIIKYTNALYSADTHNLPRYDEFRDMFSSGQLRSKEWLVSELGRYIPTDTSIIVVGAWFGTLGLMLKNAHPTSTVAMLDIDPRCKAFIDKLIYDIPGTSAIVDDMYRYNYTEQVIVNTSCEHIASLENWIASMPKNVIVALQSNNSREIDGHISCVDSEDEFIEQAGLTEVWYTGRLIMPMYTRYMIIGKT